MIDSILAELSGPAFLAMTLAGKKAGIFSNANMNIDGRRRKSSYRIIDELKGILVLRSDELNFLFRHNLVTMRCLDWCIGAFTYTYGYS